MVFVFSRLFASESGGKNMRREFEATSSQKGFLTLAAARASEQDRADNIRIGARVAL